MGLEDDVLASGIGAAPLRVVLEGRCRVSEVKGQ